VRAVDTATHPDYRGRGVFSRLTRHALEELQAEGVGFVFNTPNAQSRPGYLKMGWQPVGRVPIRARPRSGRALARLLRARAAAEKWSSGSDCGRPAAEVLGRTEDLTRLLGAVPHDDPTALRTSKSPAYLAWRYGFAPLHYRAVLAGDRLEDGLAVFRLRRRGAALEATMAEMLVPGGALGLARRLLRRVLTGSGADYVLCSGLPGQPAPGLLPVPGQGPNLVWRAVCEPEMPPRAEWHLSLGDIELF
jgi:hypothetical protein